MRAGQIVFKRRTKRSYLRIVWEFLYPKGGWGRAFSYVMHRIRRLPDPPYKIARGIFAGVFTTFTPFYGLHFFISAFLALAIRGNVLAALLATFFGNPLTYVPIGIISLQTGHFMLGTEMSPTVERSFVGKFIGAGEDLLSNLWAVMTGGAVDWSNLIAFYHSVFLPYLVGGMIPGLIAGLTAYYLTVPVISAYQKRRLKRLRAKAEKRRAAKAKSQQIQ